MTLPTCPLCLPDRLPLRTAEQIGNPDRYCTVNAHRELAVQALDLAFWNEHMWEADFTPDQSGADVKPADHQEPML